MAIVLLHALCSNTVSCNLINMVNMVFCSSSCSARGMALIGTAMANGGVAANGARVFSEETVKKVQHIILPHHIQSHQLGLKMKVHSEATVAKDFGLSGMTTKFTQAGVCHFE